MKVRHICALTNLSIFITFWWRGAVNEHNKRSAIGGIRTKLLTNNFRVSTDIEYRTKSG